MHKVRVDLSLTNFAKKLFLQNAYVHVLTCKPGMTDVCEIPGKPLWNYEEFIGSEKGIVLPPQSVSYYWMPLK
jgi:hypothetical protein